VGTKRNKRWTRAEAAKVIAAFEGSGLSAAEFARRRGIDAERIRRWGVRLRTNKPLATSTVPRMVEIVPKAPAATTTTVRVTCPSGHIVDVDFVPLHAVFAALSKAASC
jgi:transposase-like protein